MVRGVARGVERVEGDAVAADHHLVVQSLHGHGQGVVVPHELRDRHARKGPAHVGHAAHVIDVPVRQEDLAHVADALALEEALEERDVPGHAGPGVDQERLARADEVGVRPRARHEPRVQAEHAADERRQPRGGGDRHRPGIAHAGRTTVDQSKR